MTDRKWFVNFLTALGALFDKQLGRQVIEFYWRALEPYDDETVKIGIERAARELKWFPKPADIIELIEGSSDDKAALAWAKVNTALSRIGSWDSVEFDDHTIHTVIDLMGGWTDLCEKTTKEIGFMEKDFKRLWHSFQRRKADHPPYLIGQTEAMNWNAGYLDSIPVPVKIGIREGQLSITHGKIDLYPRKYFPKPEKTEKQIGNLSEAIQTILDNPQGREP